MAALPDKWLERRTFQAEPRLFGQKNEMLKSFKKQYVVLYELMLTENDIKEELSFAYIQAICGKAGYVSTPDRKDYGIDVTVKDIVRRPSGSYFPSGHNLGIQAKATTDYIENDTHIKYQLKNKNYNDLAYPTSGTKRILVLLLLHNDEDLWLIQNNESLLLQKCAYWFYLEGAAQVENEESRTTIYIPKSNIFSIDVLNLIMQKIKEGGDIRDVS